MKRFFYTLCPFIAAVFCTFTLASLMHSQFVLYELNKLGVTIDFATRLSSTLDDWQGLLPGYGAVIAIALLVGFVVIHLIVKQHNIWRYPLAGGLAMLTALLAMQPLLDITLIAGARSTLGIVCQCLAGVFGGWVFANLTGKKKTAIAKV